MSKQFQLKSDNGFRPHIIHVRPHIEYFWFCGQKDELTANFEALTKKRDHRNRLDSSYGGLTIAYHPVFMELPDGTIHVFVEYGYAVCSGLDRYVKKTGREIAESFLKNKRERYGFEYLGEGQVEDYQDWENGLYTDEIPLIDTPNGLYVYQKAFPLDVVVESILMEKIYPDIEKKNG